MKNKDKKIEKLQKEIEEIEAKLGGHKLAETELKILFAHADKKREEIEALERERGKEMETLEYSSLLEEDYLNALRKIYEERLKGTKIGSYRKPRHFVEAINQRKALKREERTLFSNIKEDALTNEIKIPPIIGVSLTRSERKLTNCFSIMLQQRSNTYDEKSKDYFSGDSKNPRIVKYGDKVTAPIPELKFTHFELTKAYTGKENPSGNEMQTVENILNGLLSKTFLIEREVIYRDKKTKEDIKYMFRGHEPLIIMGQRIDKSDENRDKTQDLIIALNSLFVLQIRDFYVTFPMDIDQRIEEAYGSKKVPEAIYTFIDYLASLRGVTRNYTHEIYKSTLYKKISEKWLQESRLKMLEERTLKAIEVAQKIGLLENWEEVDGATGEKKYIFKTNKTWIKENK
jgi:hypothetical protein